jgi:hypothetical protein
MFSQVPVSSRCVANFLRAVISRYKDTYKDAGAHVKRAHVRRHVKTYVQQVANNLRAVISKHTFPTVLKTD